MVFFGKVKSFLRLKRWRPTSVSTHEIDHKLTVQGANGKISGEPANLSQFGDRTSVAKTADAICRVHSQSSISEEIPPLDLEAELSAEDHFVANKGVEARGTFQKVDVIRWDHDEEDWALENFEFESPANPIDASSAKPPTENQQQKETSVSQDGYFQHLEAFVRLREFALRRRWLSAAAALDKASQQSAPLSKRERAAIEHVLKVASTFARHRSDSDLLRRNLPNAESREDEVELTCHRSFIQPRPESGCCLRRLAQV